MHAELTDVVLVSNRGPLAFRMEGDVPVPTPVGGGLAGTLHPLMEDTGATWVACALSEADRLAGARGQMRASGMQLELVEPEAAAYDLAYNTISNATLWFCHHHLFDAIRQPTGDAPWRAAWEAYGTVNETIAQRVADVAPEGARVLIQDYHLALVGTSLRKLRPDLATAHFTHTPFADPALLRMLPDPAVAELLAGMTDVGSCGFHSPRWAASFEASLPAPGRTFVSPLSVDVERLQTEAAAPAVAAARARLEERIGDADRRLIVRVDRMELSKNLLRGFQAFDELLEREPHRRGAVTFLALAYPTRQDLPEYVAYRRDVEEQVARINERWGRAGWEPIVLLVEDDYQRSLAALTRYDVLLVNPVRDGLNLIGKEGAVLNRRDGVLVLSREAGAFDELGHAALGINPFDCSATAEALARALDCPADERAERARSLEAAVRRRTPEDWLSDQLAAARRRDP